MPVVPGMLGLAGTPSVAGGDGLISPQTPSGEECRPFTAPLNLDYTSKVGQLFRFIYMKNLLVFKDILQLTRQICHTFEFAH